MHCPWREIDTRCKKSYGPQRFRVISFLFSDDPSQRLEEVVGLHFVHPCKSHQSLTRITTMMAEYSRKIQNTTEYALSRTVAFPKCQTIPHRGRVNIYRYVTITLEAHNIKFLQIRLRTNIIKILWTIYIL